MAWSSCKGYSPTGWVDVRTTVGTRGNGKARRASQWFLESRVGTTESGSLVTESHRLLRNLALNRPPSGRAVKAAFEHDRRDPCPSITAATRRPSTFTNSGECAGSACATSVNEAPPLPIATPIRDASNGHRKSRKRIPRHLRLREVGHTVQSSSCELCIQGIYSRYGIQDLACPSTGFRRRTRCALPADC
jgi:hypothetical protein